MAELGASYARSKLPEFTIPGDYKAEQTTPSSTNSQNDLGNRTDGISKWANSSPHGFQSTVGGLIGSLSAIISECFGEIHEAVRRHQGADSMWEVRMVLEASRKFKLWRDDEEDLDEILTRAPKVRVRLVCHLAALAWDLSQGMHYWPEETAAVDVPARFRAL